VLTTRRDLRYSSRGSTIERVITGCPFLVPAGTSALAGGGDANDATATSVGVDMA
jgi:hypothetical protein